MASTANSGPKQQRARQQLSCTACRTGKLRCNRQQPCDQCIKRSKDDSCQYLPPPQKKKQNRNTKDRIAHLEGLVVQLMGRDGQAAQVNTPPTSDGGSIRSHPEANDQTSSNSKESPSSDDSSDFPSQQLTYLKISNDGHSSYRGGSHWEAILDSIADLKEELDEDNDDDDCDIELEENDRLSTNVITGAPLQTTRSALLASVPPKHISDRLLWHWFNSTDPGLPAVHRPTFTAEYDRFWADPTSVSTVWLALLFSILSLGARIALYSSVNERGNIVSPEIDPTIFQQYAASALALADYTKPKRYLVEALMAHISCEYMAFGQGESIWLMMGIVIRVALRMGYHRDPDNFPSISVFDGEMRRRMWNICFTFDVLSSYQEGMPSMVQQVHSDTKAPSNLLDTDFGPDTQVLPPSRPLVELSPISYGVVKNRLSRIFAKACDLSQIIGSPDYEEITSLEQQLQKVYEDTPPALRMSSMNQAFLDPPNLIFNRFKLELLFHKTRCVLHRRYVSQEVVGTTMELSRKLCVDAALSTLSHHEAIYIAAQDGGPLSSTRFYIASLNASDFLLAAMILCLEVHLISVATSPALAGPNQDRVDEIRKALETSHNIWKQPVNHFADNEKALKAMEAMLRKTSPTVSPDSNSTSTWTATPSTLDPTFTYPAFEAHSVQQQPNAPMTNQINFFEPLGSIFTANQAQPDVDWNSFDKMMMEYPDPNNANLNFEWPIDLGNVDLSNLPDFGPSASAPRSRVAMDPGTWQPMATQMQPENTASFIPGGGAMLF